MRVVETLVIDNWAGPFDADLRSQAIDALETGKVLFFPGLSFALNESERRTLDAAALGGGEAKNISYDPANGACKGATFDPGVSEPLAAVMNRYGEQATSLLLALAPGYEAGLVRARASYRPAEVAGRTLSWRKDDSRLHVDAFPSRPSRGRRILRIFSNVDPDGGPRRWRLGEPFWQHAARFLPRARRGLAAPPALLEMVGLTRGQRSRYDQIMLGLHDAAKGDGDYQADPRAEPIDFPAGSTWIVFTDATPHAALAGRCAFEQTFDLDPAAMADPAKAPVAILEQMMGRALV
jgi:hypothetical protein